MIRDGPLNGRFYENSFIKPGNTQIYFTLIILAKVRPRQPLSPLELDYFVIRVTHAPVELQILPKHFFIQTHQAGIFAVLEDLAFEILQGVVETFYILYHGRLPFGVY